MRDPFTAEEPITDSAGDDQRGAGSHQREAEGQVIRTIVPLEILNKQVLKLVARDNPNVLLLQRGFQPKVIRHAFEAIVNNSAYINPLDL